MPYSLDETGIIRPESGITHRDEEYAETGFEILKRMQSKHFWYIGRHRFLLASVRHHLERSGRRAAIDMGGGCGGWIKYLLDNDPNLFTELALADSSLRALHAAEDVISTTTDRYQIDLLNLEWSERWDTVFLLDVIEHIPDDVGAMKQVLQSLRPGGYVFVTVPALKAFWSFSDELSEHQRRYSKADFKALADATGLELVDARYFMFFLSPLYWLSRLREVKSGLIDQEKIEIQNKMSQVPNPLVNNVLSAIFSAETLVGHRLNFPWGTSLLGVFTKPS